MPQAQARIQRGGWLNCYALPATATGSEAGIWRSHAWRGPFQRWAQGGEWCALRSGACLSASALVCRPVAVASRSVEVLAAGLWVGCGLLYDRLSGGVQRNAGQRARQVLSMSSFAECCYCEDVC